MRCSEAREKLIKLAGDFLAGDQEKALREHLSQCPGCRQSALAERLLAGDLEQLRHAQSPRPVTVDQVREGIAIREKRFRNTSIGVRIMQRTSDTIYRRPRLSVAAAAVFVLLLASLLVPAGTEYPVGYEVAFAAPSNDLVLRPENTMRMLAALNINDANIQILETDSGAEYRIAPLEDSVQVRRLIAVLDSLGGRQIRSEAAATESESRTIWQLLLDDNRPAESSPSPEGTQAKKDIRINLNDEFHGDFTLWMPVEDQLDDSLRGLLLNRQGGKTDIQFVGLPTDIGTNDCGWNSMLNGNTELNMRTPDGEQASFDLTDIEDVRKLETMGYNFRLMEFDTPGQIPIPGMGPGLNEIEPNSFADETVIEYMVPRAYEVMVQILDEQGREISALLDCIALAGIYHVTWDGRDADSNRVIPGTYLCRFTAGDYVETKTLELER